MQIIVVGEKLKKKTRNLMCKELYKSYHINKIIKQPEVEKFQSDFYKKIFFLVKNHLGETICKIYNTHRRSCRHIP